MLVLSRSQQQKLMIGEQGEIQITVVEIRSNYVRLGIDAPASIPVNREEIYYRIHQNPQELKSKLNKKDVVARSKSKKGSTNVDSINDQ